MKKSLISAILALVMCGGTFLTTVSAEPAGIEADANAQAAVVKLRLTDPVLKHTVDPAGQEAIRAKWNQYAPVYDYEQSLFEQEPLLTSPYAPGKLQEQVLLDALNMTKFVRYLAGMSETIAMSSALNNSAQHKVVVLEQAYNSNDPHRPARPADMSESFFAQSEGWKNRRVGAFENLHYGYLPMDAVASFMDDRGSKNRYSVGHRWAILQPDISEVGFGYTDNYTIMHLNKGGSQSALPTGMDYVAWPASGNFPTELSDFEMFSIVLDPQKYAPVEQDKLQIEVLNKGQRTKWLLSDKTNGEAGDFYLSQRSYLGDQASFITFGPKGFHINDDDEVTVKITGIRDKSGKDTTIEYSTRFFSLDPSAANGDADEQSSFYDVPANHWAREAIEWAAKWEIAKGDEYGQFKPNHQVSEAEFLAFFYRPRVDMVMVESQGNDSEHWADPLYSLAREYNVPVKGFGDIAVRSKPITRAQVAEIIAAADGVYYTGDEAIQYVLGKGYAKGKNGSTIAGYRGDDFLTRAEALQFSYRLMEQIPEVKRRPDQPSPASELAPIPNS